MVQNFFDLRDYFVQELKKQYVYPSLKCPSPFNSSLTPVCSAQFRLVQETSEYLNVSFWVLPESLFQIEQENSENFKKHLSQVTVKIGDNLRNSGKFMVRLAPPLPSNKLYRSTTKHQKDCRNSSE